MKQKHTYCLQFQKQLPALENVGTGITSVKWWRLVIPSPTWRRRYIYIDNLRYLLLLLSSKITNEDEIKSPLYINWGHGYPMEQVWT